MRTLTLISLCGALLLPAQAHANALDLQCAFGRKVSVGGDVRVDSAIDLHWKGKQYRMQRVSTTTGAQRFEDQGSGLVWISIPGKAMLLDSRRGEPVANECRAGTAEPLAQ